MSLYCSRIYFWSQLLPQIGPTGPGLSIGKGPAEIDIPRAASVVQKDLAPVDADDATLLLCEIGF